MDTPTPSSGPDARQKHNASKMGLTSEVRANEDTLSTAKESQTNLFRQLSSFLLRYGVETHGITPTTIEQRRDPRLYQLFLVWFTANFNILSISTGTVGPAVFGLGLRDSLIIIGVVDTITSAVPAYIAVFGPKLGMRGMVQCRFSWGYYGSIIPCLLTAFTTQGYLVLNVIIGGQALAAVSHKIDETIGVVIISAIVLAASVSFCGYKVLHRFESVAWIPSALAFPIMLGLSAKILNPASFPPTPPPCTSAVLSFASFIASGQISWCTFTPDYGVYHDAEASTLKLFILVYLGFFLSCITWHMMGAVFAAAAPGIPSWNAGFDQASNTGGLIGAILTPTGGFGKFLLILISLSSSSTSAIAMYSFGLSFMATSPIFSKLPRYIFAIVSEAILVPVAIIGAKRFYDTMVNIQSIIGYWCTPFASIVLTEHFVFRRSFSSTAYPTQNWDKAGLLPPGIAAVLAFCIAFGIIVPCMEQTFYTGPIAKAGTGDIGVFVGGAVASIAYVALRVVERRIWPGR